MYSSDYVINLVSFPKYMVYILVFTALKLSGTRGRFIGRSPHHLVVGRSYLL